MKRIAIFCDGTWQQSSAPHPSNVLLLAQAVLSTGPDGRTQQVIYLPGVGSGRGSSRLSRFVDRSAGGALGWGLDVNIEDAYRALVFCFEPGDEIHVFGFSRGAYTARSLVGLIRRSGIVLKAHVDRIPEAMANYRTRNDRSTRAIGRRSLRFRADYAHGTTTVRHEARWRSLQGLPEAVMPLRIAYLGVWDTVGALGIPGHLGIGRGLNRAYEFHDTALSSLPRFARHAVAVDERRLSFVPTLWDNLPALNRRARRRRAEADPTQPLPDGPPYRQEWFPGDHGAVGGGNPWAGLSSYACDWIADGAHDAGLRFDEAMRENIRRNRRIEERLVTRDTGGLLGRLWRLGDRKGPDDPSLASGALRERIRAFPDYAPATLKDVLAALRPQAGASVTPAPPPP